MNCWSRLTVSFNHLLKDFLPEKVVRLQELFLPAKAYEYTGLPLSVFPTIKTGTFSGLQVFFGSCEAERCYEIIASLPFLRELRLIILSPGTNRPRPSNCKEKIQSSVEKLVADGDDRALQLLISSVEFPALRCAHFCIYPNLQLGTGVDRIISLEGLFQDFFLGTAGSLIALTLCVLLWKKRTGIKKWVM